MIEFDIFLHYLDWLVFMHPDKSIGKSNHFIGKPRIENNRYGDYSDYAVLDVDPELFMITDMKGKGLKLRDVENKMSVKIRAQKSHFVDHVYLSACDDFKSGGKYFEKSNKNIRRFHLDIGIHIEYYLTR